MDRKLIASENCLRSLRDLHFANSFPVCHRQKTYTITLTDESGKAILTHTEGKYDFLPKSEVPKDLPPAYAYPPSDKRSEGDFLEMGTEQERNGEVLAGFVYLSRRVKAVSRKCSVASCHRTPGRGIETVRRCHHSTFPRTHAYQQRQRSFVLLRHGLHFHQRGRKKPGAPSKSASNTAHSALLRCWSWPP